MDVKLVYFKPNGSRKDFPLSTPQTVVGRGEDCDLQIPVSSISRRHCRLQVTGDTLALKDLDSSNGTFVNNKRVGSAILKAGDRLVVGPIVFTVQIDGDPAEIKPVRTRGAKAAAAAPAGAAGDDDEVVELEPDVVEEFEGLKVGDEDDVDPISALEALANEPDDEDQKK